MSPVLHKKLAPVVSPEIFGTISKSSPSQRVTSSPKSRSGTGFTTTSILTVVSLHGGIEIVTVYVPDSEGVNTASVDTTVPPAFFHS